MIRKLKNNPVHPHKQNQNIQTYRQLNKYKKLSIQSVRQQVSKQDIAVPYQQEWQQTYNRRESSLNAMFNKRKQILEDISKKNKHIYIKINNQQSHYLPKIHKDNYKDCPSITSKQLIQISKTVLAETTNLPSCQLAPITKNQSNNINTNKDSKIRSELDLAQHLLNSSSFVKDNYSRYEHQGILSHNSQRISRNNKRKSKKNKVNDIYINF